MVSKTPYSLEDTKKDFTQFYKSIYLFYTTSQSFLSKTEASYKTPTTFRHENTASDISSFSFKILLIL